jgi:hypothetical protein
MDHIRMKHPTILLLLCVFVADRNVFSELLPISDRRDTNTDIQTDGRDL